MNAADRWYTRPVFFVSDLRTSLPFYLDQLGFVKAWHEGDGNGTVCQVNHGECEIILCEDAAWAGKGRLFVELTAAALARLQHELAARSVPNRRVRWGYDSLQVDDPDGNQLLFPITES